MVGVEKIKQTKIIDYIARKKLQAMNFRIYKSHGKRLKEQIWKTPWPFNCFSILCPPSTICGFVVEIDV